MVNTVFNCILNSNIQVLEENVYLKGKLYRMEKGGDGDKKKKALALKHEFIDEAQIKFAEQIAEKLK